MAHTTGPWEVCNNTIRTADEVDGPRIGIAEVWDTRVYDNDRDVSADNARLIAAATELLRDLKEAVAWWESDLSKGDNSDCTPSWVDNARATIAKAVRS